MNKIRFKGISVEGFGSIVEETYFPLDRGPSVNIINGDVGSGKTTVFSAFVWALYKVNLKGLSSDKLPSWERIRGSKFNGTRVEVVFSCGDFNYKISRHIAYKKATAGITGKDSLMIFKDRSEGFGRETMVDSELNKADQQSYIDGLLGMDSKTFINSVVFGQRMKRIIEASPEEKRQLFESIFDPAGFVSSAKAYAKKRADEIQAELAVLTNKLSELSGKRDSYREVYEHEMLKYSEEVTVRTASLKECRNKKAELKESLDRYQGMLDLCEEYISEYKDSGFEELAKSVEDAVAKVEKSTDKIEAYIQADKSKKLSEYDMAAKKAELSFSKATSVLSEKKSSLKSVELELEYVNKEYEDKRNRLESEFLSTFQNRLDALRYESKTIDGELKNAVSGRDKAASIDLSLNERVARHDMSLESKEHEIAHSSEGTCHVCGSKISSDKYSELSENLKKDLSVIREARESLIKELQDNAKDLNKYEDSVKSLTLDLNKILDSIKALEVERDSKVFDVDDYPELIALSDKMSKIELRKETVVQDVEEATAVVQEKERLLFQARVSYNDLEKGYRFDKSDPEYASIYAELKQSEDRLSTLRSKLLRLEEVKGRYETAVTKKPALKEKVFVANTNLESLNEEIGRLEKDVSKESVDRAKSNLDRSLEEARVVETDAEDKKSVLAKYAWWNSTGFGSNGIKSFMFDSGLALLNERVQKYSDRLGIRLEFSIDLSKPSKPFVTQCYYAGGEASYAELSGGQKSLMDVVTAFALHDVVVGMADVNVLVLDEVFEGLGLKEIEVVFDLIRLKAGTGKTVFVITHTAGIDCINSKSIDVSLDDKGRTVIN